MKQLIAIVLAALVLAGACFLGSPLFIDKTVDEAFDFTIEGVMFASWFVDGQILPPLTGEVLYDHMVPSVTFTAELNWPPAGEIVGRNTLPPGI